MKRALITGAAGAIGAACVAQLSAQGWHVIAADLTQPPTGQHRLVLDVSDSQSWAALVSELSGQSVELLIHCAGVGGGGLLSERTDAQDQRLLAVNLLGPLIGTRACLPLLSPEARVVMVGSMLGLRGFAGSSSYSASKAGLRALAQSLDAELEQIRVQHVALGFVDSPMAGAFRERATLSVAQAAAAVIAGKRVAGWDAWAVWLGLG